MSETKSLIFKRNSDFEGSNIKRIRLDDDDGLRSPTRTLSSSSSSSSSSIAYSVSDSGGFCSTALSEEDDHRSSSISSVCSSSSETNVIVTNTRLPSLDLKVNQISETETSTLITNNIRKQGIPVSEILGETAEMDSATTERSEHGKPKKKIEKSPTQAEIDDFFSAAERYEQKRFTEKYNYDVVNDTPLEGRYQWVSLKP